MAKKSKGDSKPRAERAPRPARPRDTAGRLCGAVVGTAIVGWGSWQLTQGQTDLLTAGKTALLALVSALVVEKAVVPFGRLVIGPPQAADNEQASSVPGRRN